MKCSSCGIDVPPAPPGRALRCLQCGTLLNAPPTDPATSTPSTTKHSYTTPYGRLLAQVQKSGIWAAVSYLTVGDGKTEAAVKLVSNLAASWKAIQHSTLPKLQAFDEKEQRCTWMLPSLPGLVPVASLRPPLPPSEVKAIITALVAPLELLHHVGLAAFDLSPSVVFVSPGSDIVTFVPTLWLASQALWSSGKIQDMPFVAPELDQAGQAYPDPSRADVYALGALAWYLLMGQTRKGSAPALPSERSPDLANWDAFIDGCCRSAPERRFESVAVAVRALTSPTSAAITPAAAGAAAIPGWMEAPQALAVPGKQPLPQAIPVAVPAVTPPASGSRGRRPLRWAVLACFVAAVIGLGFFLRRDWFARLVPGLEPYQRGFGDTILKYQDRSYEQASWKKLKEADSLKEIAGDVNELYGIIGWDEDNFWVTVENGRVFQCQNGHWFHRGKPKNARMPAQRLIGPSALLLASGYGSPAHCYEISPQGTVDHGDITTGGNDKAAEICVIAPDLFYCFGRQHLNRIGVVKIANGTRTEMPEDKHKESLVHREDNTPLKEFPIRWIRFTRSPEHGKAIGVAFNGNYDSDYVEKKIGSFRNGIWYALDDLPKREIHDAWFHFTGSGRQFVITVGKGGYVYTHNLQGPKVEQSLATGQENTSYDLIKVWGASAEKFWVMDKNGTIWERKGTDWRVIVRGLFHDDVEFVGAWVSPKGTVIAITKKHIYRLE